MTSSPGAAKRRISAVMRRERVLILKSQGLSNRAISTQLAEEGINVSHSQVSTDWKEAVRERITDTEGFADEVRQLEFTRYERLISAWLPAAIGYNEQVTDANGNVTTITHLPDKDASRMVQSMILQERKMLGLDNELGSEGRPIQAEVEHRYDFSRLTDQQVHEFKSLIGLTTIVDPPYRRISDEGIG